jgi:hypothetical protein
LQEFSYFVQAVGEYVDENEYFRYGRLGGCFNKHYVSKCDQKKNVNERVLPEFRYGCIVKLINFL